jgi:nicotinate-nucleotide pyrophosphorylase (carboxylating)
MQELIKKALIEDVGNGDITSESTIDENKLAKFNLIAKEDFILCGLNLFIDTFNEVDDSVILTVNYQDGNKVKNKDVILSGTGNARSILKAERVALNFLQYLSGIATRTAAYVKLCEGTNIKILDTRKTVPLYRELAKYAVKVGGGKNHRMGLYDEILIKDNHIQAAGTVAKAIQKARSYNINKKIEIECETLEQVKEALREKADIIMLDNMDVETISSAINLINNKAKIEVSGNINENKISKLTKFKIDYISLGDITYNNSFSDISLKILITNN